MHIPYVPMHRAVSLRIPHHHDAGYRLDHPAFAAANTFPCLSTDGAAVGAGWAILARLTGGGKADAVD
jgi:hypothetical protein